jgi:hypothetical protein
VTALTQKRHIGCRFGALPTVSVRDVTNAHLLSCLEELYAFVAMRNEKEGDGLNFSVGKRPKLSISSPNL